MMRPDKIDGLSGDDFAAYYWLKADLVAFCRAHNLPTSGAKQLLTERIRHYLDTGRVPKPARTRTKKGNMPDTFTPETIIGTGWRCNQALRAFFEQEIGASFHFNQFMRDFIRHEGVGQSLQMAIDGWRQSKAAPKGTSEIAPQFEYNRHFRAYFAAHPNATRQDAIDAWNEKKARRQDDGDS